MAEEHQAFDGAVEQMVSGLCDMIDMYVAVQRKTLALFPECSSAGVVALGAQLDQLEAIARDGARALP